MISYLCISLATWLLAFKFLSIIQNSQIQLLINYITFFSTHLVQIDGFTSYIFVMFFKSEWNKNRSRLAELFIRVNSLNILNDRHSHSIYRLGYHLREMFYMQITHKEQNNVFLITSLELRTCRLVLKV